MREKKTTPRPGGLNRARRRRRLRRGAGRAAAGGRAPAVCGLQLQGCGAAAKGRRESPRRGGRPSRAHVAGAAAPWGSLRGSGPVALGPPALRQPRSRASPGKGVRRAVQGAFPETPAPRSAPTDPRGFGCFRRPGRSASGLSELRAPSLSRQRAAAPRPGPGPCFHFFGMYRIPGSSGASSVFPEPPDFPSSYTVSPLTGSLRLASTVCPCETLAEETSLVRHSISELPNAL